VCGGCSVAHCNALLIKICLGYVPYNTVSEPIKNRVKTLKPPTGEKGKKAKTCFPFSKVDFDLLFHARNFLDALYIFPVCHVIQAGGINCPNLQSSPCWPISWTLR
jgi:hypothetical protein